MILKKLNPVKVKPISVKIAQLQKYQPFGKQEVIVKKVSRIPVRAIRTK